MFDLGDTLLMVASDRLSAFDVVMPTGIPFKGHVLTQLSEFWFDFLNSEETAKRKAELAGHRFVDLDAIQIDETVAHLVDEEFAIANDLVPFRTDGDNLWVAMDSANNLYAIDTVRVKTGMRVIPAIATREAIQRAIAGQSGEYPTSHHPIAHHMITNYWPAVAQAIQDAGGEPLPELAGRSMVVKKAKPVMLECVVRGYITGSLWKEYRQAGGPEQAVDLHGYEFPSGLRDSDRLPRPIFTPATKASDGHDQNIGVKEAAYLVGVDLVRELESRSIDVYARADAYAGSRGLILADTKFEFGHHSGELMLIDEVLTPDSSRYWDAELYQPGKTQPSFDKQFVRDYLETLDWDKTPPGPELPDDVVRGTTERYLEAFRRLTGHGLRDV